jgi:hypothetical protein
MQERKSLRELRESLDASREDITRQAGITIGTLRNAEKGRNVTRRSAFQIVQAINLLLKEKSQPEVTIDHLDLKIV